MRRTTTRCWTASSRLQALAREYSASQADTPDPIELTLAYTRTGEYNTTIWQLTAGVRDAGFESCVNSSDPELASLQNMNTVVLPNGESIDFGHLLASMNLVYNGIPITAAGAATVRSWPGSITARPAMPRATPRRCALPLIWTMTAR